MSAPLSAQDKEWQAQDDARTLAQARIIYDDPERLIKAQQKAKEMAVEKREEATAMGKVAGSKKMPQNSGSTLGGKNIGSTLGERKKVSGTGSGSHNVFKRI